MLYLTVRSKVALVMTLGQDVKLLVLRSLLNLSDSNSNTSASQ